MVVFIFQVDITFLQPIFAAIILCFILSLILTMKRNIMEIIFGNLCKKIINKISLSTININKLLMNRGKEFIAIRIDILLN